jgi:putative transposase
VPRSLSERCRMVLPCAEGPTGKWRARKSGGREHAAGKWRRQFAQRTGKRHNTPDGPL